MIEEGGTASVMSEPFELDLTDMLYGGSALGKQAGRPIFTAYGLPGERVRVRITEDHGRYAFAVVEQVITSAPQRVAPSCPYFAARTCGGCQWQHAAYSAQLDYKTSIVREQFRRIGKFADPPVRPIIASPDEWYYRTHVTFHSTPDGELGFVAPQHNRTITPIHQCTIIRPELLTARETYDGSDEAGHVRFIAGSDGGQVIATAVSADRDDDSPSTAANGAPAQTVTFVVNGATFHVSGGSFFQVNLPQAARLVDLVLEQLDLSGRERVLDLYSGVGLFTAFLAPAAAHVTAIESSPSAVADARRNLAHFANVTIREGLTERLLPQARGTFDAAVIDPPRAGMKPKALDALIARRPRTIAYVSCDPSTLARDSRILVDHGYSLQYIQPVDMFPQTYHIECVAGLERSS